MKTMTPMLPPTAAALPPARPMAPPAAPAMTAPPQPSPMARAPVAASQRLVPSVQTMRGIVRTDTHNEANQLPAEAKHKGRGM